MNQRFYSVIVTGILLLTSVSSGQAETGYVSDRLMVNLRQGKGTAYPVVRTLQSDTPLEILAEEGDFYQVRLEEGLDGYIPRQYVSREIPKAQQIAQLNAEVDRLRQQLNSQPGQQENQRLQQEISHLQQQLAERDQQLAQLRAANPDLDALQQQLRQAQEEATRLRQQDRSLLQTAAVRWFLAGAGVLLLGWLLGRSSRQKRRSSFGHL